MTSYHTSLEFVKIWFPADGAFPPRQRGWLRGAGGGVREGGVAEGRCVGGRHKIGVRTSILKEEVDDFLVSGSPGIEEA